MGYAAYETERNPLSQLLGLPDDFNEGLASLISRGLVVEDADGSEVVGPLAGVIGCLTSTDSVWSVSDDAASVGCVGFMGPQFMVQLNLCPGAVLVHPPAERVAAKEFVQAAIVGLLEERTPPLTFTVEHVSGTSTRWAELELGPDGWFCEGKSGSLPEIVGVVTDEFEGVQ